MGREHWSSSVSSEPLTFIYVGTLGSLGAMLGGRMARLHPGGKRYIIS